MSTPTTEFGALAIAELRISSRCARGGDFSIFSRRLGGGRSQAPSVTDIHEHLIEHQQGGAGGENNKENPTDEEYRTIATRFLDLRTLRRKLGVEHLHELFWCYFGGFGFFH